MTLDPSVIQRVAQRAVVILCLGILTVSALAVLGAILDMRTLSAMGRDKVPMSLLGAGLMLALGSALLAVEALPDSPRLRQAARLLALGVLLTSLGVVATHVLGFLPALARWPIPGRFTSLLTGAATSIAALSALIRWLSPAPRWRVRQVAALLAQAPLAIGTVVLVSYAAGAPFLYESGITPMSLPSALSSVGLGLALMLAAGCDTWPLAVFGFVPGKGHHPQSHWFTTGPLALFLGLSVLVLSGGSFFLRGQLKATRAQAQTELATIAEFKAHQIGGWLGERRAVAGRLARGALIQDALRRFLAGSPQAPPESQVRAWLEEFQKGTYRRVVLLDAQGRVRLSAPSGETLSKEDVDASEFQAALRSKDVVTRDLHQHAGKPDISLSLWIPVGTKPAPGSVAEGVLVLVMDPREFLFPLVRSWPTASPSAETLLVRREGDDILYLNELRHRAQPAMSLRVPLGANPSMPSTQAALGHEGMVVGTDYRGEPVLAALHQVPGTTWGMVAKVDEAEVYGPLRRRVWIGGIGLIGVVVLVAAGLGMMVRHHDTEMIRKQLHLSQRFEWLMREANDVILLMDGDGRIQEANSRALEQYGYTLSEMQGMSVMELRSTETREEGQAQFARMMAQGAIRFETVHRRKNGSTFAAEISARLIHLDREPVVVSFLRDITERRIQQRELQRMTQLYAALSQVNQAIVWSSSKADLLDKICEVLVAFGRFDMAWIGWEDPETHQVAVAARFGDTTDMLSRISVRSDDTHEGHGAVGTAIRQGRPCIINDFLGAPESSPWREDLAAAGLASIGAFPIRQGGEVVGALAVYAGEKDVFGTREVDLLVEAAMDISFALDHLAGEERRRETEIALLESERMLREAQEAGQIGTYTWFIQEDHWKCSPYLERIFGIGPDHPRDLEGWTRIIAPEFREDMRAYVAGIIERHEHFDLDYPIVRASDGAARWVHGRGDIQRDSDDRPVAMVGIIRDVSELKWSEEERQRSEEIFSKTFKASPESIFITNLKTGVYVAVNDVFLELMGRPREAVIGHSPLELDVWVDPDARLKFIEKISKHGSVRDFEAQFRMKNGAVRDCLASTETIQLQGEPCALNFIRDITEHKKTERTLKKIRMAVEQSPLSIVITDPQGVIEYVNPAFTATTGYASGEAVGHNPRLLKSPKTLPDHYRQMWETLIRGEIWVGEFENQKKSGEPFQERAIIAPVRDEAGVLTGYIAIKEDITLAQAEKAERRSLEAQLHQSQKLESLGSLAGGVAHDMNNVLGAVLGLASVLRETADPFSPGAKSLDTIMNACMRGRGVVKSLLYFAKKDLQEERPIDLNDLVKEMSQLLSHTTLKRVLLGMDLKDGIPMLRGDSGALSHALMNLCVNAMDAMPNGGTLRIRTDLTEAGGLMLSVRDTGEGMSPEVLAKAMEPFFTTKPLGKGTGLGLAMVYGTMKAHEGTFELQSEAGKGTEAILRFPASRVEAPAPVAPVAESATDGPNPFLHILLVDDDELIRESVAPLLEVLGHTVTTAPGGARALNLLETGLAVDLVILDMNMPGISGAEALPRILELRPGLPVIMATGYSDQEVSPLLEGRPSVSSLRKPFSLSEVRRAICEMRIGPIVEHHS